MIKVNKTLERMGNNPRDWTINDLKTLANMDWRQPGTSHVTFSYPGLAPLTVPSHKPVKPIYVMRFLDLLDSV
jgi:hypothetical protein